MIQKETFKKINTLLLCFLSPSFLRPTTAQTPEAITAQNNANFFTFCKWKFSIQQLQKLLQKEGSLASIPSFINTDLAIQFLSFLKLMSTTQLKSAAQELLMAMQKVSINSTASKIISWKLAQVINAEQKPGKGLSLPKGGDPIKMIITFNITTFSAQ